MASYIGVSPPEQTGIVERYKYAGDGSTTAFSGADTNAKVLRYTSTNPILVFLNGVQLVEGTDFTKTSNTVVTFATAPTNGDDIEILTFGSFDLNSPSTIKCDLGLNTTDSPTFASATLTPDLAKLTINSSLGKIFEVGPRDTSDNSNRDRALLKMINDNFYTGVQLDPGGTQSWINYNNTKCFGVGQCNPQANLHVGGASIFDDNITLATNKKLQLRDSGTYINSNADGDLDIVSDGTANESIKLTSAGGIYLQADGSSTVGTIRLDAQSGVVNLYRDGTLTTSLNNEADGDVEIHSRVSNADLRIRGNDGGSDFTALTFDMSAAGTATFNHDLILPNNGILQLGDAGENIVGDGTNLTIASSQNLILDTANELKLDSTVGINLLDNGTSYGLMADASGDFVIKSQQSDKNLIIKGNDGGSTVNALTFDMSEAGNATFNGDVTVENYLRIDNSGSEVLSLRGESTFGTFSVGNRTLNLVANATLFLDDGLNEIMRVHSNGMVGIGTTAPGRNLTVFKSDYPTIQLINSTSSTDSGQGAILQLHHTDMDLVIRNQENADIRFDTNGGNERMRIMADGKVGIGTSTPSQILDIAGGSIALEDGYGIRFGDGSYRIEGKDDGTNARIGFITAGSEAMRINSSGNVGIGTTSPATPLHLVGACARFESDTVSRSIEIDPTSGSVEMTDNTNSLHLQRNHDGPVQVGFQSNAGLHVKNCAGFGASPATGIPVVVVKDSVSTDTMLVQTTESSQSAGPIISLKRNSSSPADADYLGQIKFKGENDADQETLYAKITGKIDDASDGSEDGLIEFANIKAGSNVITARLKGDALQLTNGLQLHVDGNVGIGTTSPDNMLHIAGSSGLPPRIKFTSDQFSAVSCITSDNGQLQFYADKDSGQGNSKIGFHVDNLERGCFLSDGSFNISSYMIFGGSQHRLVGYGENVGLGHDVYINQTGSAARNAAIGFEALLSNTTGSDLSVLGHSALKNNTTGGSNVAIGSSSMLSNVTGQLNVAVGAYSLKSNTNGCAQIAIGVNSLCTNTTGVNNIAIGHNSLRCNTSGIGNVGIGYMSLCCTTANGNIGIGTQVLQANTTGIDNVAIGCQALFKSTTAQQNTAIGTMAGACITTGCDNVIVGSRAFCAGTTGLENVAVGRSALRSTTTGSYNVAIGSSALTANTTGRFNVAIGREALCKNTSATSNTAVGNASLRTNTVGSSNTAVGINSMFSNTTGYSNTALGASSLNLNTTGIFNVAVGVNALCGNTVGDKNTAVGACALKVNTTGKCNTAVGMLSLGANTTGFYNTGIGYQVLTTNSCGNCNTGLGYRALAQNTTGNNNTAVGLIALQANTTGTGNTAVGYFSSVSNVTGTCNTAVGNLAGRNNNSDENVFIGYEAGCNNLCGSNVFIGSRAGKNSAGTSQNNTIIGRSAFENGRGSYNVVLGRQSLHSTGQSQNYNTALGFQTLCKNTTSCNVAIGSQSGFNNTTGTMTAVGYQSLYDNTTGVDNTAVGFLTLTNNTIGTCNTAIGVCALQDNTTGGSNTAVGFRALCNNTTGISNTAVGVRALHGNLYGVKNTSVGESAMQNNSVGVHNIAMGYQALVSLAGGNHNTGIGTCALYTTLNSFNTAVGSNAGKLQGTQSAKYNIYLGYNAGCDLTTGAGNIIIGTVQPDSNTGDRQLKIAGYDGSTTTTWISGDSSGNLTTVGDITLANDKKVIFGDAGEHIYGDGTNLQIRSSNSLGIDVPNGITLDSGSGGTVLRAGGGTTYGTLTSSSGDFSINQTTSDKDIIFTGNDGGSTITAMTIDMSAGGNLIVAGTVTANGQLLSGVTKPTISSISPTVVTNAQSAITITGANFVSIPQVEFLNPSTGIYYLADSVAFSNSTSITVTATLPVDGSYKIRIENGDGEAVLSGSILTVSDTPTFSTAAGSLGTFAGGFSGTIATISASSDSTITFSETTSVLSGANVSLNTSTGALTTTDLGGSSTTPTTYNFTLRATDGESQTADRTFSITTTFGAQGGAQFN